MKEKQGANATRCASTAEIIMVDWTAPDHVSIIIHDGGKEIQVYVDGRYILRIREIGLLELDDRRMPSTTGEEITMTDHTPQSLREMATEGRKAWLHAAGIPWRADQSANVMHVWNSSGGTVATVYGYVGHHAEAIVHAANTAESNAEALEWAARRIERLTTACRFCNGDHNTGPVCAKCWDEQWEEFTSRGNEIDHLTTGLEVYRRMYRIYKAADDASSADLARHAKELLSIDEEVGSWEAQHGGEVAGR